MMIVARTTDLIDELRGIVQRLPDPQPEFHFRLAWAQNYDALFAGEDLQTTPITDLLNRAMGSGRVLLTARGGAAKTVILTRVAKFAFRQNFVAVAVCLKGWTGLDYDHWSKTDSFSERIGFLLQRFVSMPAGIAELDAIPASLVRIVIIDGLNEVDSRTGQEIINAVDEYARFGPNTSVIVSDRLVRRELMHPEGWQLATVLPLGADEIRRILALKFGSTQSYDEASAGTQMLLATPYFLDDLLEEGTVAGNTAGQMYSYFLNHALTAEQLDRAAAAAFSVYGQSSRTFYMRGFREIAGATVTEKLLEAGALVEHDGLCYFDHHLKHDYLAARYLVANEGEWNRDSFNRVSFYASSFETVAMMMEQLNDVDRADLLLRRLYDWNIYAAGFSLTEGRDTHVSREMYVVILAMFAERRWDLVQSTAIRARDILNLFDTAVARQFLAAPNLMELFGAIKRIQLETDWFDHWRALFTKEPGQLAANLELDYLGDKDSVIGWTTSNVLKRLRLRPEQQRQLRENLTDDARVEDVVKWRTVHVLGSFPSEANAQSLLTCLKTGTIEVRYGATRSLVEMAALAKPRLTDWITRQLSAQVRLINMHRNIVDEFKKVIFIDPNRAPRDWSRSIGKIIENFQLLSSTVEDSEQWARIFQRMVSTYEG